MSKITDAGKDRFLGILFVATAVDSTLYLGLYKNTTEPSVSATMSSISETTGSGYARIALNRGSWTVTNHSATYAQQEFTATGSWGNVYGYFISTVSAGTSTGALIAVDSFSSGAYTIATGDSIKITPRIS